MPKELLFVGPAVYGEAIAIAFTEGSSVKVRSYGSTLSRSAVVEPVVANPRTQKRMDHFTYRGKAKVKTQWMLYCLVHSIDHRQPGGCGEDPAKRTPKGETRRRRASQPWLDPARNGSKRPSRRRGMGRKRPPGGFFRPFPSYEPSS